MVLRDSNDPLNQSRGIMGPLENAAGVQNNRGRLRQRFDLIRKLGQGTYGKVQLGIDKETGQEVAIKTIKKSKIETEADLIRIRREIQIMSSVKHPNIIHIYEVFENREKMVLVMEYAAGGELYDYLSERKILQEDEARRIFRQIASAVYYCHKHKICHRDLKLENILLDEKFNAKIADFGLSNVFDEVNMLKTFCGSPLYASPEIVRGTPYSGPEVDCWSLGVLLYTLVYGAMPFDGSNFKRLVKQISHGDYFEPKKPAEASPLIRIMLTVDPKKRADAGKVCAHPWVNQGFDKDCLAIADELATQTPVRLDLLLALANCSAINHNQVVVGAEGAAGGDGADGGQNHVDDRKDSGSPTKPKRKIHSKSKSKSSPLLDLIPDVREELEIPSPIGGRDDDECDTLSEISEIQTVADEFGEDAVLHRAVTSTDAPPRPKKKKEEKKVKEKKEEVAAELTLEVPPAPEQKKTEEASKPDAATETVTKEKVTEEGTPKVVKKKVKPKVTPPTEEAAPVSSATPAEKPLEIATTSSSREVTPVPPAAATVKEKSSTPDKEGTPDSTGAKTKKLKERADSVSPTRIERRNSKVISQKTAELIQNLETKVSPSTGSISEPPPKPPGIKKIVIPSFKVSDAKSKFESKPPRPLTTSVSRSKAAFEAKALQSQSSVEEKSKPSTTSGPSGESSGERSSTSPERKTQPAPPPTSQETKQTPPPEAPKAAEPSVESHELQKPELEKRSVSPAKKQVTPEPPKPSETKAPPANIEEPPKPKEAPLPPPKPAPRVGVGKIQIPAVLADKLSTSEVKPVLMDSGKGGPRPAMMIVKGKTQPLPDIRNLPSTRTASPSIQHAEPSKPSDVTPAADTSKSTSTTACNKCAPESDTEGETKAPPLGPAAAAKQKLLSKLPPPPQNKEQAVKQISSMITKIVNSGSSSKGLNTEEGPKKFSTLPRAAKPETEKIIKTEVVFPVNQPSQPTQSTPTAAQPPQPTSPQERIIPIQLVDQGEEATGTTPSTPSTAVPSASPSSASVQQPSSSRSRMDSFRRLDSSNSVFSRQDSSDTESCSFAPPTKLEPIRKCPREFLIPIKLESSGHTVTPKEDLTASTQDASIAGEDDFRMDSRLRSGRFGRQKRYSSLLSDSSFDDDASVSISQAGSRRPSTTPGLPPAATHTRSRSQGDEQSVTPSATFKRYRSRRHATAAPDMSLDRSDSFSSAEEDEEDAFQVLTAESLFSNLLDRVRNLTRRINRDDPLVTPNWSTEPGTFGLWGASPLREFMSRAPSEARSFASSAPGSHTSSHRKSFSREPSATIAGGGPGSAWRRSLSRDLSGDSDSGHSPSNVNPQSRTQLSSRLSSDLYGIPGVTSSSVRSLPLSSKRSPYLSQRSVNDSELLQSTGSATLASPRYSRTLSHADYGTSSASRTLPLRRSLKTFDRSPPNIPEYDTSSLVPPSSRHSLLDGGKYEPGSYLTRLRSMSRDRERESSVTKSLLGTSGVYSSGECNGWVGGLHDGGYQATSSYSISPVSTTVSLDSAGDSLLSPNSSSYSILRGISPQPESSSSRLSVQEKMNNYSQYYQSLSQHPLRRVAIASPSQIHSQNGTPTTTPMNPGPNAPFGVGLSQLGGRPSSIISESSALPLTVSTTNCKVENGITSPSDEGAGTPQILSPSTNVSSVTTPSSLSPAQLPSPGGKPSPPIRATEQISPKAESEVRSKPPVGSGLASTSSIPRWPTVQVRQHRPLSISSFPDGQRASSVSRVLSPPPQEKEGGGVEASVQKRRESRATSVERITRLLERKSMPREMTPTGSGTETPSKPKVEVTEPLLGNGVEAKPSGLKKPKFLQSLEKKWEKLTHSGSKSGEESNKNGGKAEEAVKPPPVEIPPSSEPSTRRSSEDSSTHEEKINESVLLRRALSPEKKVKTNRLASGGTVNLMLGKFKKFQETPAPESPSKIPTGRPPIGSAAAAATSSSNGPSLAPPGPALTPVTRFGRRLQAYTGAASDSVLSLSAKENGRGEPEESGIIKSAVMAQVKRRPKIEIKKDIPSSQQGPVLPSKLEGIQPPPEVKGEGIPSTKLSVSSEPKPPRVESPLPEIQIEPPPLPSLQGGDLPKMDLSSLSPISVTESVPHSCSSVSIDESLAPSPPPPSKEAEDAESVSDRILRKSFYNRFNPGLDKPRRTQSIGPNHSLRTGSTSGGGSSAQSRNSTAANRLSTGSTSSRGGAGTRASSTRRSISPSASTVASFDSNKDSDTSSQPRSPSPWSSSLNKYHPNPLFKELITNDNESSRASDVGKKTEYSRRITSKLSKLLREIESDLNSCQLSKTASGISEDGDSTSLMLLGGGHSNRILPNGSSSVGNGDVNGDGGE